VLAINYRGGSGFGREFQDLAVNDWLNGQARDPGSAADFLRTLPYVNGKVGIYGGSYGGMQSMAAITRTPDKFDAAVPMRGIFSQTLTFEHMDRLGKIFSKTSHGGLPDERPEIYSKSNTIERFAAIRTPLLIMHGEIDDRAPFKNHELAVAELTRLGKTFEAKSYPNEGHGFRNPDNQIDMYQRLEGFFGKHLGSCSPAAR
jgi:dipeptidyl aminopeptidase/acylaminoacyl peptidase